MDQLLRGDYVCLTTRWDNAFHLKGKQGGSASPEDDGKPDRRRRKMLDGKAAVVSVNALGTTRSTYKRDED